MGAGARTSWRDQAEGGGVGAWSRLSVGRKPSVCADPNRFLWTCGCVVISFQDFALNTVPCTSGIAGKDGQGVWDNVWDLAPQLIYLNCGSGPPSGVCSSSLSAERPAAGGKLCGRLTVALAAIMILTFIVLVLLGWHAGSRKTWLRSRVSSSSSAATLDVAGTGRSMIAPSCMKTNQAVLLENLRRQNTVLL